MLRKISSDSAALRSPPPSLQALFAEFLPFLRKRGFEAGDRLPSERDLAERFAVSRASMREALASLEAMRVIERRPQSGIYLRDFSRDASLDAMVLEVDLGIPMTPEDVSELVEFRLITETHAVTLACARHDRADLDALDAILAVSAKRLEAGQSLADQDAEFHLAIFAAAKNQFLQRAANSFYLASRRRRNQYFDVAANGRRSLAQHRRLRDAIAERNPALASDLLGRHLGTGERYWRSTLVGGGPAARDPERPGPAEPLKPDARRPQVRQSRTIDK